MWWGRNSGAGIRVREMGLQGLSQGYHVPVMQDNMSTEEG